jgi:hypothetical protein
MIFLRTRNGQLTFAEWNSANQIRRSAEFDSLVFAERTTGIRQIQLDRRIRSAFSTALRPVTGRLTFVRFAVFGCKYPVA